jgi:hypothetical protein
MQKSSVSTPWFAVGFGLAAFCGAILSNHLGAGISNSAVVPGFAVGLILITQSYVLPLKSRISQLERRLQDYDRLTNT